jgi:hypothetical protein
MSADIDLKTMFTTIVRAANRAEIAALKSLEGAMKVRVHNDGGAEDGQIGRYSPGYAKLRRRKGRQVAYVDLALTDELAAGYTVGKTLNDHNALGFTDDFSAYKARKNEEHFDKVIFAPTKDEEDEMDRTYIITWSNLVKRLL